MPRPTQHTTQPTAFVHSFMTTRHASWRILGSNEAPPPQSDTGQPLDGAPAVVHVLHFCFQSSSLGCLLSTMLNCFPSGVQLITTLVMELASLGSTCLIQCHHFLVMMASISSCWHRAKRSQLEMVLGQKMHWIFLRLDM